MAAVVLEDAVLFALARRPEVLLEFPELRPLSSRPAPCCGRPGPDTRAVKQAMAFLGEERRRRLRELLGARTVRLYLPGPGGISVVEL